MKKLLLFIAVFSAIAASAQFPGTGFTTNRNNAIGVNVNVYNANTAGFAGFMAALPTLNQDTAYLILKSTKSILRSTVPLDIQAPALTLNGGPFSGSGVWSTSGSKIYYAADFVGIGTATVPYPLSVQTQSNSDADIGAYFRNVANSHTLAFYNNKFLTLTSAQPELVLRATLSDTTVPRATLQFRDHLGVATGSLYNKANSLYFGATTGRVIAQTRQFDVQDGTFRVYDVTNARSLFQVNLATYRTMVGPGVAEVNSTFTVHPVDANRVGAYVNMDGAVAGAEVYGIAIKVDDDNALQENIGISIDARNAGGGGESVPIVTVETGLTTEWDGAMMQVADVAGFGMKWKARARPFAQRAQTFTAAGNWDQRFPSTAGVYFDVLDSVIAQGGTWAAAATIGQHMTSTTDGSFELDGWGNDIPIQLNAVLNISTNLGTGATSVIGCRWALNGVGIAHTEQRRYLPSTFGPQQIVIPAIVVMDVNDVVNVQCVCGAAKPLVTFLSVAISAQTAE